MCDIPQFKAAEECLQYEELLHYTSFDVLKIILGNRTLKLNSIKNLNDQFEQKRKGIEELAKGYYVTSFCHYPHEIVPFWFMYGNCSNDKKVLLRFQNFSHNFENAIDTNFAWTAEDKILYYDQHNPFHTNVGGISFNPINDPKIESRQTIATVRLFDIEYRKSDDEVFTKNYATPSGVSFDKGNSHFTAPIKDVRTVGKYKTINWEYEGETRLQCQMSLISAPMFDSFLIMLHDEIFRGLKIVTNPWATNEFLQQIRDALDTCSLSEEIKKSIVIMKSELDGQISLKGFGDNYAMT